MGSVDSNCLLTGISLRGIDVTAVVLRRQDDTYRPITFGIKGSHDGNGGIDEVVHDRTTELIARYFAARSRDGSYAVGTVTGPAGSSPPTDPSQRYPDSYGQHDWHDAKEFLERARHDYREAPEIQTGLAAYEHLVHDQLDEADDEQLPTTDHDLAELLTEIPVRTWTADPNIPVTD
ncbi:hypothetical protein ACFXK0_18810 [Nocardia sp. NPDC059177]|uniref:hypothetical protein n=1 Tax=Nocardia sp. NPDC059177 TaxID=3346759 RepID=UPI0036B3F22B